jgi:hypothetical protein
MCVCVRVCVTSILGSFPFSCRVYTMANTAMYDRIIEKIKQHPLRPEEIEALRRGRENLKRHGE